MLNSFKVLIKLKEKAICQEWDGTYGYDAQENGLDGKCRFGSVYYKWYVKPRAWMKSLRVVKVRIYGMTVQGVNRSEIKEGNGIFTELKRKLE